MSKTGQTVAFVGSIVVLKAWYVPLWAAVVATALSFAVLYARDGLRAREGR